MTQEQDFGLRRRTPKEKAQRSAQTVAAFEANLDTFLAELAENTDTVNTPGFRDQLLKAIGAIGVVPSPAQVEHMAMWYQAGHQVLLHDLNERLEAKDLTADEALAQVTVLRKQLRVEKTAADTLHSAACSAYAEVAGHGGKEERVLERAINATGPELPSHLELTRPRGRMLLKVAAAGKGGYAQPERAGIRAELAAETRLLRTLEEAGLLDMHALDQHNGFHPYRYTLTPMGQIRAGELAAVVQPAEPQLGGRLAREQKEIAALAAKVRDLGQGAAPAHAGRT